MSPTAGPTRLVDIVFPGDTNHHGTLFGGVGLAHMDKVAYIAAARHARVDFVTASCERINFDAPAHLGDIVELTAKVARVGRRSLSAEVDFTAEAPLSGARRRCGHAVFNLVAVGDGLENNLPPLPAESDGTPETGLRMVELVLPQQTSHYGSLYGGHALAAMGKAAFVAATRHCRKPVVMASSLRVDFESRIHKGEVMELAPRVIAVGKSSMTVEVELLAENLLSGVRRRCGKGAFVMVAVDAGHRPVSAACSAP